MRIPGPRTRFPRGVPPVPTRPVEPTGPTDVVDGTNGRESPRERPSMPGRGTTCCPGRPDGPSRRSRTVHGRANDVWPCGRRSCTAATRPRPTTFPPLLGATATDTTTTSEGGHTPSKPLRGRAPTTRYTKGSHGSYGSRTGPWDHGRTIRSVPQYSTHWTVRRDSTGSCGRCTPSRLEPWFVHQRQQRGQRRVQTG